MSHKLTQFITAITIMLGFAAAPLASAQGKTSVGLRGGFTTTHKAPVAGLYFNYRFVEHFRLGADIDYYFRNQNTDAFAFNINAHAPFAVAPRVNLYPLAGFNLTTWNDKTRWETRSSDDSSTRENRFGFNVGGGAEYMASDHLRLALEGKYSYVRHYDGGVFTLSIGYIF